MTTCRFELKIKNTPYHVCAVKYDGWAHRARHDRGHEPCLDCPYHITGHPITVDAAKVTSTTFPATSEQRIREQDWAEFERRGV